MINPFVLQMKTLRGFAAVLEAGAIASWDIDKLADTTGMGGEVGARLVGTAFTTSPGRGDDSSPAVSSPAPTCPLSVLLTFTV